MKLTNIIQVVLLLSAGYINSAQAITIGFDPESSSINMGDSVRLGIIFDISEESFGGTFQVNYDKDILANPQFGFVSDAELTNFGIQPGVSKFETIAAGSLNLSFGTLSFSDGVLGSGILGYLTLDTISEGTTVLELIDVLGGFTDFKSFAPQQVDYQSATVVVSSVPLPASLWLFASAFGVLLAKRKNSI